MARLFLDECVPVALAERLRRLGHDVLTCVEAGLAGCGYSDERHLADRKCDGRILVSFNRKHFYRLHERDPDHPGIIVSREPADLALLAVAIHDALQRNPDLHGRLIRVRSDGPAGD